MKTQMFVNLVFQGGGVRVIAYAGVLAAMPHHCRIHSVGGTSGGALVAALLAIGVGRSDLKTLLRDRQLFNLLNENDVARTQRLRAAWQDARRLWDGQTLSRIGLLRFRRRHPQLLEDLRAVWTHRGLHSSDRIRESLDNILQGKRFKDVEVVHDLKIVAADVSTHSYVVYDKANNGGDPIAEAVHASISIPLFFKPFTSGPLHLVDGGLLSNFPTFLFADSEYPTIGFRLADISPPTTIDSTASYLKALVLTMTGAHDKRRGEPPHFKAYPIETPPHIPSNKFDLSDRDVNELYTCGLALGRAVEWDLHSSSKPVISFYDPKPHDALELSLSEAHRLWEQYAEPDLWPDGLHHEVLYSVHIELDWSTRYDRLATTKVLGSGALFLTRMMAFGIPRRIGRQSLTEMGYVAEEVIGDVAKDLVRIPAFNKDDEKGVVCFYIPPVTQSDQPRLFHTGFRLPLEFAGTVGKGQQDTITFSQRQLARDHHLKGKIRVCLDVDLPDLTLNPSFATTPVRRESEFDGTSRRTYRVVEFTIPEVLVSGGIMNFEISVAKKEVGSR